MVRAITSEDFTFQQFEVLLFTKANRRIKVPGLLPDVDPNGLVEYSVVYTDRSVNHMSLSFREVMTDISST